MEPIVKSRAGIYILNDGLVNGYPHWFEKVGSSWVVYDKLRLGDNIGGIAGPQGKDSNPNEIKEGWKYYNNGWHDAGPNDVIFKAICTGSKLSFHKINSVCTSRSSIQLVKDWLLPSPR